MPSFSGPKALKQSGEPRRHRGETEGNVNALEYRIREVDEIPDGLDWLLIDEPWRVTFVVKRTSWNAEVVAQGWAAYRKVMRRREDPALPPPRWLRAV